MGAQEIHRGAAKRLALAALCETSCCTDVMSFCRQVVPKLPSCFGFGKTLTARFLGVEHQTPNAAPPTASQSLIPHRTLIDVLNFDRRNDMTGEIPLRPSATAGARST